MGLKLDDIDTAIAEIAAGRAIIVVDDEDRENEADLIVAASKVTPEQVAFMVRHTSGILCTALPSGEAKRLQLAPMVAENDAPLATAFTVSVDYRDGLTTGISAEERCNTIRALANHNVSASDFVRPGHIFPLVAKEGGVLMRTGHTEAAVDFARLAGLPAVGLLSELVNDDGTVKKGDQIEAFAREHGLCMVSIDDLIAYRQRREQLIARFSESQGRTVAGEAKIIVYETPFDTAHHVAVVVGEIGDGRDILVRLQREDTLTDVFNPAESGLPTSLDRIRKTGRGVVVYLRQGAVGVAGSALGVSQGEGAQSAETRQNQWREIGLGAQILKDLGVRSIVVLGSRERQYVGLSGFGVEVARTEIIDGGE